MLAIKKPKKQDFRNIFKLLKRLKYKTKRVSLNPNKFLVAKKDNKIIGLAYLSTFGIFAHLNALIVRKKHRSRGIGSRLLKAAVKKAKNNSCRLLLLSSNFKRKKARKFYQKNNFKRIGSLFYLKI